MAIADCSECGGKVATTAKACPHCGHRSKPYTPGRDAAIYVLIALIALFFTPFTSLAWVVVAVTLVVGLLRTSFTILDGPPKKK